MRLLILICSIILIVILLNDYNRIYGKIDNTSSHRQIFCNYSKITKLCYEQLDSNKKTKEVSNLDQKESKESDTGEYTMNNIITIDIYPYILGLGSGYKSISYQHKFSKSLWSDLTVTDYKNDWDDIKYHLWRIKPSLKLYWGENAPDSGYVYMKGMYEGGYINVGHTNLHERLSNWGAGLGIGRIYFFTKQGTERADALIIGDISLGFLNTSKDKKWTTNEGDHFKLLRLRGEIMITIGFLF